MIIYFKERKRENLVFFLFVLLSLIVHAAAFVVFGLFYDFKPASAQRQMADKVVKIQTMNIPPSPPSIHMPDYQVPPQPPSPPSKPPEKKKNVVPPLTPSAKPTVMPSVRPVPTPTPSAPPPLNGHIDKSFEEFMNFRDRIQTYKVRDDLEFPSPMPSEPPLTGAAQFKKEAAQPILESNPLNKQQLELWAQRSKLSTEQLLEKIYENRAKLEADAIKQAGGKDEFETQYKQFHERFKFSKEQFLFLTVISNEAFWELPSNLGQEPAGSPSPDTSVSPCVGENCPSPLPTPMPLPSYQQGNIGYSYISFDHDGHTFRLQWDAAGQPVTIRYYPITDPTSIKSWEMPWLDSWKQNSNELVQAVLIYYERQLKIPR